MPSVEKAEPVPRRNGRVSPRSTSPSNTGQKREADDSDLSDVIDNAPAKKKRKESVDDDAAFAAKLQAEEDRAARPTRGGAPRKQKAAQTKKAKTSKKKKTTSAKVTGSDDSDIDDSATPRKVNRNTGFHKPMNLSEVAADFFGTPQVGHSGMKLDRANSVRSCPVHR